MKLREVNKIRKVILIEAAIMVTIGVAQLEVGYGAEEAMEQELSTCPLLLRLFLPWLIRGLLKPL